MLSHSSTAVCKSQRSAFADWDHTRTTMAYWPSSASTGTKKPFLPLLRLGSYLLLFGLGEAHRDYLEAQCCCSVCYYLQHHYLPVISLPIKLLPNFWCTECQCTSEKTALSFGIWNPFDQVLFHVILKMHLALEFGIHAIRCCFTSSLCCLCDFYFYLWCIFAL